MPVSGNSKGKGLAAKRVRKGVLSDEAGQVDRVAGARASRSGAGGSGYYKKTEQLCGSRGRTGTGSLPESANMTSTLRHLLSDSQKTLNFHLLL